jgi:hypothetical protein
MMALSHNSLAGVKNKGRLTEGEVGMKDKKNEKKPFVNKYGVVIGDHFYDSPDSPLNNWSKDTDPAIMSGDQWVHPTNDIGWNTRENQELLKKGKLSDKERFMHPTKDVSYLKD